MDTKFTKYFAVLVFAFMAGQVNTAEVNNYEYENAFSYSSEVDIASVLQMYIRALKGVMPCGLASQNISVLAPFKMSNYNFNFSNAHANTTGSISNLLLTGLNGFEVLSVSYNATSNLTSFDIIFPELQVIAESDFTAMAYVAGYPLNMAFSGPINMKLQDFRIIGEFILEPQENSDGGLLMSYGNMKFYIGDIVFNNWNNLWNTAANNYMNKIARTFILMWSEQMQDQLAPMYAKYIMTPVNDWLSAVTMNDLITMLTQETLQFTMADCNSN